MSTQLESAVDFRRFAPSRGITRAFKELLEATLPHAFIAGGYARFCISPNKVPAEARDIDIFLREAKNLLYVNDTLQKLGYQRSTSFTKASSWKFEKEGEGIPVNLILPFNHDYIVTFGTELDVVTGFDLSVCRAVFLSPYSVLASKFFLEDEINMRVRVEGTLSPVSTMLRMVKYAKKGYRVGPSEILSILKEWDKRAPEVRQGLCEGAGKDWSDESFDFLEFLSGNGALDETTQTTPLEVVAF